MVDHSHQVGQWSLPKLDSYRSVLSQTTFETHFWKPRFFLISSPLGSPELVWACIDEEDHIPHVLGVTPSSSPRSSPTIVSIYNKYIILSKKVSCSGHSFLVNAVVTCQQWKPKERLSCNFEPSKPTNVLILMMLPSSHSRNSLEFYQEIEAVMREGGDSEDETITPLSDNEECSEAKLQVRVWPHVNDDRWTTLSIDLLSLQRRRKLAGKLVDRSGSTHSIRHSLSEFDARPPSGRRRSRYKGEKQTNPKTWIA